MVRGHRSGLLTSSDYNNLAQCESLDDIKLNLVSRRHCCFYVLHGVLSMPLHTCLLVGFQANELSRQPSQSVRAPLLAVGDRLRTLRAESGQPAAHDYAGRGVHPAAGGSVELHACECECPHGIVQLKLKTVEQPCQGPAPHDVCPLGAALLSCA